MDGCGLVRSACDGVEVLSSLRPILGRVCQDASQDFCSMLIIVPKGRYPVGHFSNSLIRDRYTLLQKNRGGGKGSRAGPQQALNTVSYALFV